MKEGIVPGAANSTLPTSGLPCLPADGDQRRESPEPLVCVNVPRVSRVLPRGRGPGPLRQLRSQPAAKEALFLDPDCDRPPVYSCYLWSNCPGLNLNSFSIIARFCFLKINHGEYLSLGRARDQPSMKVVNSFPQSGQKFGLGVGGGVSPQRRPVVSESFSLLPPVGA